MLILWRYFCTVQNRSESTHWNFTLLLVKALACMLSAGTVDISFAAAIRQVVPGRKIGGTLGVSGRDFVGAVFSSSMDEYQALSFFCVADSSVVWGHSLSRVCQRRAIPWFFLEGAGTESGDLDVSRLKK